jgi:hypothetical protein
MKLVDLKPKWATLAQWCASEAFYTGITFLCPHCLQKRLYVRFWPPVDPEKLLGRIFELPDPGPEVHRRTSGESFESLTIDPSIGFESIGHWHGRIINGEVV